MSLRAQRGNLIGRSLIGIAANTEEVVMPGMSYELDIHKVGPATHESTGPLQEAADGLVAKAEEVRSATKREPLDTD
jgi:hypothetical protein